MGKSKSGRTKVALAHHGLCRAKTSFTSGWLWNCAPSCLHLSATDNHQFPAFVDAQNSPTLPASKQISGDSIADKLFYRITHWPCTELRVKAALHDERQHRVIDFDFVSRL